VRHSRNGASQPVPKAATLRKPELSRLEGRKSSKAAQRPKIADLFAGVGGFGLGAARAGFDVAVAIDLDRHAIASHKKNFPHARHRRWNIANLTGEVLLRSAKLGDKKLVGIIGGPPCQGFSTMGRRRKNDKRNPLFLHFFRLVSELKPLFFVAENVPGILDSKFDSLRAKALKLVSNEYQIVGPFTLSASDFGAATNRSRVFFVGVSKLCEISLSIADFQNKISSSNICVRRALAGLSSRVMPSWQNDKNSWRKVERPASTKYLRTINRMSHAIGDPTSVSRFNDKNEISGFLGTRHHKTVVERFSKVAAGKMDKVSKFPRLRWDGLCPTLRAGTDSSRGSYQAVRPIHPDENRVITPREAARLQGFPDWFQFSPTKWHSFRQIGNSVSPFVAEAVLDVIRCKLFPEQT
jgi:DNA (cytosine-5)-methyltransferase 1